MDTKEFDERNFAKSRAVCESMGEQASTEKEELRKLLDECGSVENIRKRLMPEGMEWLLDVWPKWSNGDYCKFGDLWVAPEYGNDEPETLRKLSIYTPEQLKEWGQDKGDCFGYEWDFRRPSDPSYRPKKVKPEPPDSWERLEEDAKKGPCDYFGYEDSESCEHCPAFKKDPCGATQATDVLRRAKTLAEKENGGKKCGGR